MRFVVVGAGAVGGVVAARLHAAGQQVVAVARGAHLEAIRERGLNLATPTGTTTVVLPAVGTIGEAHVGPDDVVVLAVKSQDTHGALRELAAVGAPEVPVVCLQNGVANEPSALRWFANAYGVVVMLPATFLQPGVVAAHSAPTPGILDLGRWPSGTDELAATIVGAFQSAGFASEARADVARWKYAKLLANLSNVVDALCGPAARSGPLSDRARDEGRRCLDAAGIGVASPDEDRARRGGLLDLRDAVGQPRGGSSSWQSLARATGSIETDYLNGEIVRLGRLHGVATPVNELLQRLARDHAHDRRPPATLDPGQILEQLAATDPAS